MDVTCYGRFVNGLGHDTTATSDKHYQKWMTRGVEWAATSEVLSDAK